MPPHDMHKIVFDAARNIHIIKGFSRDILYKLIICLLLFSDIQYHISFRFLSIYTVYKTRDMVCPCSFSIFLSYLSMRAALRKEKYPLKLLKAPPLITVQNTLVFPLPM